LADSGRFLGCGIGSGRSGEKRYYFAEPLIFYLDPFRWDYCRVRLKRQEGEWIELGKLLILLGTMLVVAGVVVMLLGRTNFSLGRLPGDFLYRGKNTTVYFPLATSVVVSVVLSILLYVVSRWRR
jgi:Protein of unknown function (DUF2905)